MRTSNSPRTGMLLLVTSNGLAASVDSIVKHLSSSLHGVQITWGFFLMMFLPVLGYALASKKPFRETVKTSRLTLQLIRSAMLALTLVTLFVGIAHIPLADAISIVFMAPLFITVLAVPMLGETLSYRRLAAVLVGLAGVVIIMRPGGGDLHWAYFMPLGSAVFFALYQLMTRQLTATEDWFTTLFYTGRVGCSGWAWGSGSFGNR